MPLCVCGIQSSTVPGLTLADCSFSIWLLAKMPRNDDHGRWPPHLGQSCKSSRVGSIDDGTAWFVSFGDGSVEKSISCIL